MIVVEPTETSHAALLDRGGAAPAIKAGQPRRLQRSRRKGTRTPDGVIYAGRPSWFGNPFQSKRFGHARSVTLYGLWIERRLGALSLGKLGFSPHEIDALARWRHRLDRELPRLFGRDVECWCPVSSRWCHVDIPMAYAERVRAEQREAA